MGEAAASTRKTKPTGSGCGRRRDPAREHQHLIFGQRTHGRVRLPHHYNAAAAGSIHRAPEPAARGPARRSTTQTHSPSTLDSAAGKPGSGRYTQSASTGGSDRLAKSRAGHMPPWGAMPPAHTESFARDREAFGSPEVVDGGFPPEGGVRVGSRRVAGGTGDFPGAPQAVVLAASGTKIITTRVIRRQICARPCAFASGFGWRGDVPVVRPAFAGSPPGRCHPVGGHHEGGRQHPPARGPGSPWRWHCERSEGLRVVVRSRTSLHRQGTLR